jgi:hypothetical protein
MAGIAASAPNKKGTLNSSIGSIVLLSNSVCAGGWNSIQGERFPGPKAYCQVSLAAGDLESSVIGLPSPHGGLVQLKISSARR